MQTQSLQKSTEVGLSTSYEQALEPAEAAYLQFHRTRFAYLNQEVLRLATLHGHPDKPVTLLDIGPHFQTSFFRQSLGTSVLINTLGWQNTQRIVPQGVVNQHFTFDLNDTPYRERWVDCPQHDIVVMAEVFEHVHTAPEYFLSYIRTLLKPGGHLLIGTPNAVSLNRRLSVLRGYNPYEPIRVTINNPGHFREYTVEELTNYARVTGFAVERTTLLDFYPTSLIGRTIKRRFPRLRNGIHTVFQKTHQADKRLDLVLW